jgi:hypothetical protein
MASDGSFPLELKRTKPYGYSLFNLEAMAGICQILSTPEDDLWTFVLPDGRGMRRGMEWIYPFIEQKSRWSRPPDVMYFDAWPVRQSSLIFAAMALHEEKYLDLWKKLDPDPTIDEVVRNFPVRQPILWIRGDTGGMSAGPEVMLMDPGSVRRSRQLFVEQGSEAHPALARLVREAEKALSLPPVSVVDKPVLPPSLDKHDYMSLAPYWWPDPTTATGLPYIRRDGEINPERSQIGDRNNWRAVSAAVQTLGLAYYCTGKERYAAHAGELLRTWFLADDTRMNPNLNFAQAIRGMNDGRGAGVIDFRDFNDVLDAIVLLTGSPSWTPADEGGMRNWARAYLEWLRTSPNGKAESVAKNNHGTWYDVQVARTSLFLGLKEEARTFVEAAGRRRIASQIEPDGSEPLELVRTKSWGYSMFNLEALVALAMLGDRVGVDLWTFTTPDGRSISKVIDFLLPYALEEREWEFKQIVPMERNRLYPILQIASTKYPGERYRQAAEKLRDSETDPLRSNLVYPRIH